MPKSETEDGSRAGSRADAFQQLKQICSQLLACRNDAKPLAEHLAELLNVLAALATSSLQPCFDYVAFPLLYITDSIDHTRRKERPGVPLTKAEAAQETPFPAAKSDKVAEACLSCLALLLHRCRPDESAVPALLSRICPLLQLQRSVVNEEIRRGALQCISELFFLPPPPALADQDNAALLGFTSHVLLSVADAEIQAGQTGSKAVLAAAVACLGRLIEALAAAGGQDTLAFLLPGIVSGLYKVLLASGSSHGPQAKSGAAASTKATAASIQALMALLRATMADSSSPLKAEQQGTGGPSTTAAALEALKQMRIKRSVEPPPRSRLGSALPQGPSGDGRGQKLAVARTAEWRDATAEKLQERLKQILPLLQAHPQAAVRGALAAGAVALLEQCPTSLASCRSDLLQVLLTLAQDGWAEVAAPCVAFLTASSGSSASPAVAGRLAAKLLARLPEALGGGSDEGRLHAQSTASALQVAGPEAVGILLRDPGHLLAFSQALERSFAFNEASASLLLYAAAAAGSYAASPQPDTSSPPGGGVEEGGVSTSQPPPAVLLPSMPHGLSLISGPTSYEAVAGVCRTLGRLAACNGDALRSLTDQFMERLAHLAAAAAPGWQGEAAAVVTVLSEFLFGASAAWVPQRWLGPGVLPGESQRLVEVVEAAQLVLVSEPLWGVQTQNDRDSSMSNLTPQELGENALLARSLLLGIGCFARALGPGYLAQGSLVRVVLMPLLERLGDGCPGVSAAASDAVASICLHCGCTDLRQLVADNLDYVVDGVCARLRRPDQHPRSPLLFAVLLRRCGVAPSLLALMAEPARAAVRSLGILARQRRPGSVAPFLAALKEIVAGAAIDAEEALEDMRHTAGRVADGLKRQTAAAAAQSNGQAGGSEWAAETYFRERMQEAVEEPQVEWDTEAWAAAESLRRRLHAAAVLADSAADASGPLLTHSSQQVVLLALDVCTAALQTLASTSAAKDLHDRSIEPHVAPRSGVQPVAPDVPLVLPAVHRVWSPLVATLKDSRIVVLEHALPALAAVAEASGGDFLSRRLKAEAWPLMADLLMKGPRVSGASGGPSRLLLEGEEPWAPAVVRRARQAVLDALARISSSSKGRPAVKGIVSEAATAAIEMLSVNEAVAVKGTARQVLASLAYLDSDVVWLRLLVHSKAADFGKQAAAVAVDGLRPWRDIAPQGAWYETAPCSSQRVVAALLQEVEAAPPAWHTRLSREAVVL